jgi:DHA1 family inner membrane transport protein
MKSERTLPLLAAANFSAAAAGMIIAGILQLIAADLHWTSSQAGHLITWYALGFAVGAPLLGVAMGTWCRKQVVIVGLLLIAAGSFSTALAAHTPWIEISRLVVAAGSAMTIPSVSAIAAYLFPDDKPRALGFALMGMTLAIVMGLPIGTYVAGIWGWQAPLLGAASLAALTALAVKLLLPGGIVVPPVPLAAWRHLLALPGTYPLLGLPIIVIAATFSLYAYIAPFLVEMLGLETGTLSLLLFWYGVASLVASAMIGWFSKHLGGERLLLFSLIGLTLTLGLTWFAENRMWLVFVLFGTWATASSFFGTLQQARVVDASPASGSALLALNSSANFAGQALGTLIGGWIITTSGLAALSWASALLAGLGVVLLSLSAKPKLD